jgi:hypothetical protein
MKKPILSSLVAASALVAGFSTSPLLRAAEDEKSPGKASDSVKEPATKEPAAASGRASTGALAPGKAPGKESDAVHETKGASRIAGRVTEINRDEKTIVIEDESRKSHKLHIGAESKLMKGKEAATWDHLKQGTRVRGTVSGTGERQHVVTLDLQE